MVILNIEKYKSLKEEITKIKNGESNNKIEDIVIEMKKCIDFQEKHELDNDVEEILKEEAQIYTTYLNGVHAIVKVRDNFYDINGNIKNKYDKLGYKRNDIDLNKYFISEGENFWLFSDLCTIARGKEIILKEEKLCDTITDELIKELKYS